MADIPLPPGPLPPLPGEKNLPPVPEAKTTYESAPVLRDLRKEAAAFVPVAVKRKLEAQKALHPQDSGGQGEEEAVGMAVAMGEGGQDKLRLMPIVNAAPDVDEEIRRFNVEMEDAVDESQR